MGVNDVLTDVEFERRYPALFSGGAGLAPIDRLVASGHVELTHEACNLVRFNREAVVAAHAAALLEDEVAKQDGLDPEIHRAKNYIEDLIRAKLLEFTGGPLPKAAVVLALIEKEMLGIERDSGVCHSTSVKVLTATALQVRFVLNDARETAMLLDVTIG